MSHKIDEVEQFLLNLEHNEQRILSLCPDHLLLPTLPFFQLVHVINIEEVIKQLATIEIITGGQFIRVDGYLTLAIEEQLYQSEELRCLTLQLFEIMRF
ncbi:hypothetical protein [Vibrio aestuarianus]|uniref:hypothetical protein n=1 Tax=Vibrio aestuarianus TaxID=28171 RepID=UPI00237CD5A5|nr:hypothetical protein [Vibrio aestuarianus]MDE1211615.1 hypothetical protein [Vibrio aestuarianus]MDE1319071.1 hypothetical protein [Vibrio aestuarianus]